MDNKWIETYMKRWGTPDQPFEEQDVNRIVASLVVGDTLLDVCCGMTHFYYYLRKSPIKYTGIDKEQILLDKAHQYYPHTNLILGNLLDLSKIKQFDTVVCLKTLGHYNFIYPPDKKIYKQALDQLWSKTKKRLIFTLPEETEDVHDIVRDIVSCFGEVTEYGTWFIKNKKGTEDFLIFTIDRR